MKNEIRVFCSVVLTILVGTGTLTPAQERKPAPDKAAIEREITLQRSAVPDAGDFFFLATEMAFGGKVVKGAPYSAQAVTESIQTLNDGNRIVNKSTAAVYRDSEGRTRREQTLRAIGGYATGGEPSQMIFINDPVADVSYTLDQRTQIARKMPPMRFKVYGAKAEADYLKQVEASAGTAQARVKVLPPNTSPPQVGYRSEMEADMMVRQRVEAGVAMGWLDSRNPEAKPESLGKQNIEGVEAEGSRTTVTIPAGEIGNELPIKIVNERWYSAELQVIVMTRHSDPRFGENTYRLTNINRNEPARELFEVPAGYTVKEPPAPPPSISGTAKGVTGGVLNSKAISLPVPEYPAIAKEANAQGTVTVQVTIDEEGNVIAANAVSGHPLLRAAAVTAARQAKFSQTKLSGQPVKVTGVLTYNFSLP